MLSLLFRIPKSILLIMRRWSRITSHISVSSHDFIKNLAFMNASLDDLIAIIPQIQRLKNIFRGNHKINIITNVISQSVLMTFLYQLFVIYHCPLQLLWLELVSLHIFPIIPKLFFYYVKCIFQCYIFQNVCFKIERL